MWVCFLHGSLDPSIHPLGENVKASPLKNKSRNSDLQSGANSAESDADKHTITKPPRRISFYTEPLTFGDSSFGLSDLFL